MRLVFNPNTKAYEIPPQDNTILHNLYGSIQSIYGNEDKHLSCYQWLNKHTTIGDKPFSVAKFPFQEEIINDNHPNMWVIKISQVGVSEVSYRKLCAFLKRNRGTRGIYSLPNILLFNAMSDSRIKPFIKDTPIFNNFAGTQSRSRELYQIDQSYLHVVNASVSAGTSLSADYVAVDEVDLTDTNVLSLLNSRTQASDYKIHNYFSTPTFADFGIDAGYKLTDKRERLRKCPNCNHWYIPQFGPESLRIPDMPSAFLGLTYMQITKALVLKYGVDLNKAYHFCPSCKKPQNLRDSNWAWVATNPSVLDSRGYKVRPFSDGALSIPYVFSRLFDDQRNNQVKNFENTVLGEVSEGADIRLPLSAINGCFTDYASLEHEYDPEYMYGVGFDLGATCHVTLGRIKNSVKNGVEVIGFYQVDANHIINFIADLTLKYKLSTGGGDRYPYTPTLNTITAQSGGIILPFGYEITKDAVDLKLDPNEVYIKANRTTQLDDVATFVKEQLFTFSGYTDQKSTIVEHLRNLVREETKEKAAKWVKLTPNDHYFHALGYLLGAFKYITGEYNQGTGISSDRVVGASGLLIATPNLYAPPTDIYGRKRPENHLNLVSNQRANATKLLGG